MTDLTAQPIHHTTCRICHAPLLPILSLGSQYLSDFPAAPDTKAYPPVPLDLTRCSAPQCGLVQLAHTTPQAWMYSQYWYRSGVNESMRAELKHVVEGLVRYAPSDRQHLTVADIGANDGTLLSYYPEALGGRRCSRVAWEPAKNLYEACRPHAEVLFPDFFHASASEWHGQVHCLSSVAMFYDLDDPHQFVGDVANLLHKTGVWVIQQAYLGNMLATTGYDNIGHEHLEYYHLAPLEGLLASHGLEVFHVEKRKINGGSFRTYVGWKGRHPVQGSVAAMREEEAELFKEPETLWTIFGYNVRSRITELQDALDVARIKGPVDLLGCSTKGSTLLQTVKIDHHKIRQAWERSPEKVGRYYGVTGIPIVAEEEGRRDPPATLLCTPWQFRDSLVKREAGYLKDGGAILFPLPTVELVRG